jgi:DNA-binding winged helix-turn-helix (wHTH) protein
MCAGLIMKFQFGEIRVDGAARQVWRGAQLVHLPRKAFDLLLLLIEHRPNAVSKEQIHERLWPETYVSEASVQALISDIRQAIGDDGRRRRFLRTVHGLGYAFSAQVLEEREQAADAAQPVRAWLVGELGRIPLFAGDNTLGRGGGEHVTEVDDTTVSRCHARISIANDQAVLEDLGSKNGTFLADRLVTSPVPLEDGKVLVLGSARFTFRFARTSASTDSMLPRRDSDQAAPD